MPILNYTTSIAATKTASEVVAMLAEAGARRVTMEYAGGQLDGLSFTIDAAYGPREFALPARVAGVHRALAADRKTTQAQRTAEHARKVAWRILKDWVEAQLAMVEAGMAALDEVMFPYALEQTTGRTAYQVARDQYLAIDAGADRA